MKKLLSVLFLGTITISLMGSSLTFAGDLEKTDEPEVIEEVNSLEEQSETEIEFADEGAESLDEQSMTEIVAPQELYKETFKKVKSLTYHRAYRAAHKEEIAAYQKDYQKAYRAAHKEAVAAYKKKSVKKNEEEYRKYQKAYRENHKEDIAAYKKDYIEKHKGDKKYEEKCRKRSKDYYEKHKEEIKGRRRKRYQEKKKAAEEKKLKENTEKNRLDLV